LHNTVYIRLHVHRRLNLMTSCIKEDTYLGMRVKSDTLGHGVIIELIKLTDSVGAIKRGRFVKLRYLFGILRCIVQLFCLLQREVSKATWIKMRRWRRVMKKGGRRVGFEQKEDFDLAMSPHFLDEKSDRSSFSFDSVNNAVRCRYHRKQFDFLSLRDSSLCRRALTSS